MAGYNTNALAKLLKAEEKKKRKKKRKTK